MGLCDIGAGPAQALAGTPAEGSPIAGQPPRKQAFNTTADLQSQPCLRNIVRKGPIHSEVHTPNMIKSIVTEIGRSSRTHRYHRQPAPAYRSANQCEPDYQERFRWPSPYLPSPMDWSDSFPPTAFGPSFALASDLKQSVAERMYNLYTSYENKRMRGILKSIHAKHSTGQDRMESKTT